MARSRFFDARLSTRRGSSSLAEPARCRNQDRRMQETRIVIVGGGPVGMALAVALGLRGIACVLVEPRTGMHRIPKGQNLTQRTLEHFYFWGIADDLRRARVMPPEAPIGEITAYGDLASEYWHAPHGRELVRPYYFQDNDRMPQYRMEEVLRAKLSRLPSVETRYGWRATGLTQDADGVRVDIVEEATQDRAMLAADYAVGCDGGGSMVREASGIARSGTDFDQLMVLVVFRSRDLHEKLARFPPRSTYRVLHPDLEGYWQFFGRIDVGEGFFFHAPVARDTKREGFDFRAPLRRAAGFDFACEIDHAGFWQLRNAVADTYRSGRVFIAGDAAHTHPPYGGFGLNNGLEDAVNLGWKLAARLEGWGGEALLESYSAERQPVFREVAEDFIAARIREEGEFLARYNPGRDRDEFERAWAARKDDLGRRVNRFEPNYEASPVVVGPAGGRTSAHGEHAFAARAGHHLAPQPLSSGRNVFEELGRGFTLLALDAASADVARIVRAAEACGVPLTVVRDSMAGGRENYGAKLVLVRPDQFVAFARDVAPADADALLRRVSGRSSSSCGRVMA
jgi:2-polyprenyl-6-methoxyphenol hydroxylase-like FAD-dependent oxidoreductase